MKRNSVFLAALLGLMLLTAVPAKKFIIIGSGGYSGTYYPVSVGIAKIINTNLDDIHANAISTGGSLYNIVAIQTGHIQLAIAQNDTCYYAFNGTVIEKIKGKPTNLIRGIASLYKEPIHIIARSGSDINSIADLRGHRVYVGDVGSGTELNTKLILRTYGLTFNDLGAVVHGKVGAAVQQLLNGEIDALFFSAAVGSSALVQAAEKGNTFFLSLDQEHLNKLERAYPFYSQLTIPAGSYPKQQNAFTTVAVSALLIASADLAEEDVYRIAKLLFVDKIEEFKAIKPVLAASFSLEKGLEGMSIPIHKGAARLYHELKITIPDKVKPVD